MYSAPCCCEWELINEGFFKGFIALLFKIKDKINDAARPLHATSIAHSRILFFTLVCLWIEVKFVRRVTCCAGC